LHYNTIEELETGLAISIEERHSTIPNELQCKECLSTSLAWDNFDHNNETLSGKDTLHDTVSICYQIIFPTDGDGNRSKIMTIYRQKRNAPEREHLILTPAIILNHIGKKTKINKFNYNQKMPGVPFHLIKMIK
jgi:hypothetical protein